MFCLFIFCCFSLFSFSRIEPPDCAGVVCDMKCPSDSKVMRIYGYDPSNLLIHASEPPPNEEFTSKRKRAIQMRKRESYKAIISHNIRSKREINDTLAAIQKCCECKCDDTKCPEHECPPNEYKITISLGTQISGNCCPKYACSAQKPTCYSHNLKQQFNPLERWEEDACTQCECTETGEMDCETPICKPLNCEKKHIIEGECCPVCDISDSKFCEPHIVCDRYCRNGFEHDSIRNCAICACAQITQTTEKTTISTESGKWNSVRFEKKRTSKKKRIKIRKKIQFEINFTIFIFDISDFGVANSTIGVTTTVERSTWNPEQNTNGISTEYIESTNASSTKPITNEDSWYVHLPIVLGICITIGAFAVILSLTCRHISHKKDKHHLNRKQNTPLI